MAKSIRSKWKRKCRAVKRERYGKKELDRLKKTLGIEGTSEKMEALSDEIIKEKEKEESKSDDMITEVDMIDIKKKFNHRTLRNENGAYPVWVHPRKIKKAKHKGKKGKEKKTKA